MDGEIAKLATVDEQQDQASKGSEHSHKPKEENCFVRESKFTEGREHDKDSSSVKNGVLEPFAMDEDDLGQESRALRERRGDHECLAMEDGDSSQTAGSAEGSEDVDGHQGKPGKSSLLYKLDDEVPFLLCLLLALQVLLFPVAVLLSVQSLHW